MNKLKLIILGTSLAGILTLSACTFETSVGGGGGGVYTDPYYHAWYDVYGSYCGTGYPTAGCNFYADGYKIIMTEDPYYSSSALLYYDIWSYTNSYGYLESYYGYAWLSPSGILYDEYGNALNEQDEDSTSAMDVIAQAAEKEKQVSKVAGKALAEKYGLAEAKGVEISKNLQGWAKLGKERARTDTDKEDFAKRLYGIDPIKAQKSMTKAVATKDISALDEVNIDVAAHWGTDAETSGKILKSWYKEELSKYGVK